MLTHDPRSWVILICKNLLFILQEALQKHRWGILIITEMDDAENVRVLAINYNLILSVLLIMTKK